MAVLGPTGTAVTIISVNQLKVLLGCHSSLRRSILAAALCELEPWRMSMANAPQEDTTVIHLSVVVPIYNEDALLMGMAEQLVPHLDKIAGEGRWQFVLVDNGSSDRSLAICDRIIARWPNSIKVELDRPDYGEALFRGWRTPQGPGHSLSMWISGMSHSWVGASARGAFTTWLWDRSAPTIR